MKSESGRIDERVTCPHKRFYEKVIKVKADVAAILNYQRRRIRQSPGKYETCRRLP
jgi:hypothetical protein